MKKAQKRTIEVQDNIYDIHKYTLRKASFKYHTLKAKQIISRYEEFSKPYVEKEQLEIQKLYSVNPEMFEGISQDDIEQSTTIYLKKIKELLKNPELAIVASKLEKNNDEATEVFLLTDDNAKQICDILFEDCDVNHSDEHLDSLSFKEFRHYVEFVKECFRFFLKLYQTFRKIV